MYSPQSLLEQGRLQDGSYSSCRGHSPLEASQPVLEMRLLPSSPEPSWRSALVTSTHTLIFAKKTLTLVRTPRFSLTVVKSNTF